MTNGETEFLCRELDQATCYFEYGAGESTKLAARRGNLSRIVSTESDRDFIESELMSDADVRSSVNAGRLEFVAVDVGPTGRWGRPADRSKRHQWPDYPKVISKSQTPWDLVLVDGLFRVACVAEVMLQQPEAKLFVHDFWRRKRYRPVFRFCEEVESVDELVLLRRKPDVSNDVILKVFDRYAYLPSGVTWLQSVQSRFGVRV